MKTCYYYIVSFSMGIGHNTFLVSKFGKHKNYVFEIVKEFQRAMQKIASLWLCPRYSYNFISILVIFPSYSGVLS